MSDDIARLIESTPFVDTHEHLWDESTRLRLTAEGRFPRDFSAFFFGYPSSDLVAAGLPFKERDRFQSLQADADEKWRLIEPYYARAWHTGYMWNVRESLRCMVGEEDITRDNYRLISERLEVLLKPGHYEHVLRKIANIEYCQVASLEAHVFHETEAPNLLAQDFHVDPLCLGSSFMPGDVIRDLANAAGCEPASLADWHGVIDWHFERYAPRAVAIKHASAYARRLDYAPVTAEDAAPLFARFICDPKNVSDAELKALQDHLFHYCVRKAVEYGLPTKMHTGYFAGSAGMPLDGVRNNMSDLCPILQRHPDARFVFFHIAYPYQHEAMAMAKSYPNACIDLCWAWIIDPLATVRFVKEFLLTVPANKLLCFGGDYWNLEGVPGHAVIARRGLTQAMSELVAEGWVKDSRVPELIDRLMRGNAHELFKHRPGL